jgi:hypothetical protein
MPTSNLYATIASNIAKHGHMVMGVGAGRDSFFYSIGLAEARLPELLVTAPLRFEDGTLTINRVAAQLRKRERPFDEGQELDIDFSVKVRIHNPTDMAFVRDEFTIQAGQYFHREDYAVQQILLPDRHGVWPGQPGHAMPQRLL